MFKNVKEIMNILLNANLVIVLSLGMFSCKTNVQGSNNHVERESQEKENERMLSDVIAYAEEKKFFASIYVDGEFSLFAVKLSGYKAEMHTVVSGTRSFCVDRINKRLFWLSNKKNFHATYDEKLHSLQNQVTMNLIEKDVIADIACNENGLLAYLTYDKDSHDYFIKLYDTINYVLIKELRLSADPSRSIYFISVSPDGKYVGYSLYESENGHPTDGDAELWILDLQNESTTKIGIGSQHRWSQDAKFLYSLKGNYFGGDSIVRYDLKGNSLSTISLGLDYLNGFTYIDGGLLLTIKLSYNPKTEKDYATFELMNDAGKILRTYKSDDIGETIDAAVCIK